MHAKKEELGTLEEFRVKYKIEETNQNLIIKIEGKELQTNDLREAFQQCQEGSCDCPTDEYDKLEEMRIEQSMDRLSLHLKVKPGQTIVQDAIAACLDHTFKKSKKDD